MIIKYVYSKIIQALENNHIKLVKTHEIRLDRLHMTPHQYWIANGKGMEKPFTGQYYQLHKQGIYKCVHCNNQLFSSETKFDSQTGYASFYQHYKNNVKILDDYNQKIYKSQQWQQAVQCMNCKSFIGQFSRDGPAPTFLRYSINSCSLKFVNKKKEQ